MPTTITYTLTVVLTPMTAGTIPLFPGGGSPSACDAVLHDQQHFLDVVDKIFPPEYVEPMKVRTNAGYENFQAGGKLGERLSLAVNRLECGSLAIFAPLGAKATGIVSFSRPVAGQEVTIKRGSIVTTSRGARDFVTTSDAVFAALDLGPVNANVEATTEGYEWNLPGEVVTLGGEILPGDIDVAKTLFQDPPFGDATFTVTQSTPTADGVSPMLEGLGKDRGIERKPHETKEAFRFRVRSLPDTVSPGAILRAVTTILDDYGLTFAAIETFDLTLQTVYDAPSPNAGTPTFTPTLPPAPYDSNLFVYDDPRPEDPLTNIYFDLSEVRGAFYIVLQRVTLLDVGLAYDDPGLVPTDFKDATTGRQRGTSAYDIPATADPDLVYPAAYDGYDIRTGAAAASVQEELDQIKIMGVKAVVLLQRL